MMTMKATDTQLWRPAVLGRSGQCAAVATGWAGFDRTMGFLTGGPRLQFAGHAVSTWPGPWDPGTRMEREAQ